MYPPAFDALHAVSDLHLGGTAGFQIFDQGPLLAAAVDRLRETAPDEAHVLVLNGDLVDFLAEAPARYLDPQGGVDKLDRIAADPAFAPVFDALRRYVQAPRRHLALTLGNHDLELALPPVRARLTELLCGDDPAARGRLTLAFDGAGYTCRVGGRTVLCVHGNEVDTWNVVDHEALRRVALDLHRRRAPEAWTPNAGTRLVVDVMNEVKRRMPLVDLLKPEDKAVVPVLVALDPSQLDKVRRLGPVLLRLVTDRARQALGFLGDVPEEGAGAVGEEAALRELLGGTFAAPPTGETTDVDVLLQRAEERMAKGDDPLAAAAPAGGTQTLGAGGLAWDVLRRRPAAENLREALRDWLHGDDTFDPFVPDDTFRQLDREIGAEVDVLLAGHTHLERALDRRRGGGRYYNSGTWIRLIRLTDAVLGHADAFRPVYEAFADGTMDALDAVPELVLRRPSVVSVWRDDGAVHAALRRVEAEGDGAALREIDGTRHTRS